MWSKFASTRDLGSLLKQRQIPRALGSETQTLQADVITFAWLLARGKHPQTGSIAKPFCRSSPRPSFCPTFAKRTWVAQDRSVPSPIRAGVESCSERSQQGDSVPAGGGSYPRIPGRKATYPVVTGFFFIGFSFSLPWSSVSPAPFMYGSIVTSVHAWLLNFRC